MRRAVVGTTIAGALVLALVLLARPYARGLSFVVRAADLQGTLRRGAEFDTVETRTRDLEIPTPAGTIRARVFEPTRGYRRTALAVAGLHPAGIDESRAMELAQQLAASGVAVVTPEIPQLTGFEFTAATTDTIERIASWLAADKSFAPDGRIGMMGFSVGGGLTVVAAGRPALRGRVAYVFSLGGHHDLPRVLRYLCTGVLDEPHDVFKGVSLRRSRTASEGGGVSPPHDYGVAMLLLGIADRLVPVSQAEPLKTAVRRFLKASAMDRAGRPEAHDEFAALRLLVKKLPQPSATLLDYVVSRDVARLGARLLPHLGAFASSPALSPSQSPKPEAPVFLLHGVGDNVIPAAESLYLARDLGRAIKRLLLTNLIAHAEATGPARINEVLELAGFWGDLLDR
jgi:dienelactone hydrolase